MNMKQTLKSIPAVVLGNFLLALTLTIFLIPSGLVTGGTTGLALTVEHFFSIPISGFVLAFNILMLLVGWLILGWSFAATTLASSLLFPVFLEICQRLVGPLVLTSDLLLCTVFSGLGIGISLGIVIRSGASTGGMDIPPLALKKLMGIPVSVSMYAFDFGILLLQALFRPTENILYGIVLAIIYTAVLDRVLLFGNAKTELKIISAKYREITAAILTQIDRGVTLLNAESGYAHNQTQVVLSVISNRELIRVEHLIREIDPECFMVVSRVSEVRGRGFSLSKDYKA